MSSAQHVDSAPLCFARVGDCCRFLDLDAFDVALDEADLGWCERRRIRDCFDLFNLAAFCPWPIDRPSLGLTSRSNGRLANQRALRLLAANLTPA